MKNTKHFYDHEELHKINKITVDYHRVTKISLEEQIGEVKNVTWEYTERLIIDRETESIEHVQNVAPECVVTRKFQVEGGVRALLDSFSVEGLFNIVEDPPVDVIETPDETKDYKITIDYEGRYQRIIIGTYDNRGLPTDWTEFAEEVLNFMLFYGIGEILDPTVYKKIKRRKSDYIYCSVTFNEDNKTYYYITDNDNIEVGDLVMVPVGEDNHLIMADVVDIEYFSKENAPFPVEKTKRIVRICTDEDFE